MLSSLATKAGASSLATKAGAMARRGGALLGTGKGPGPQGFLWTLQPETGTGSGGTSAKEYAIGVQVVSGVLGVASLTAMAVHHIDQREIKRVEGERAAEIKSARAKIKRVEGERRLSEERLSAEVDRYKYDLQLRFTHDFKAIGVQVVSGVLGVASLTAMAVHHIDQRE
ncbi:hypothetical protein VYU27_009095, partial [Nannochloropsis oceanica]